MLNTCPPTYSCGTGYPLWTDEEAPDDKLSPATIDVYGSNYKPGDPPSHCNLDTYHVEVMKCSLDTDYDLIYRYIDRDFIVCAGAFCGMN